MKKSAYVGWGALGTQKNNQFNFIRKEQEWKVLKSTNLKSKM